MKIHLFTTPVLACIGVPRLPEDCVEVCSANCTHNEELVNKPALWGSSHQANCHCLSMLMSRQPYHVHVIIPCYKDSLTDMKTTLLSALSATMPPGCTRTIFLVDDSQASRLQGPSMLGPAAAVRPKALCHADRWVACRGGRLHRGSWLCCDVQTAPELGMLAERGAPAKQHGSWRYSALGSPAGSCAPVPATKQAGHPKIPGKQQWCPVLCSSAMQPGPDTRQIGMQPLWLQDYEKQRWCEEVEKSDSQIIYISSRLIPEQERSAKAGMLNFCLGKIYPDQATARAVGFTELICVFKSDQVNRGVKAS